MSKQNVVYISPIASRSGYGDCSRSIATSLIDIHKDDTLNFLSKRWGVCMSTELNSPDGVSNSIKSKLLNKLPRSVDISYQVSLPHEFEKLGNKNIGFTAGFEFLSWTSKSIQMCNELDLLIVHSKFAKDALLNTEYNEIKFESDVQVVFQSYDDVYLNNTSKTDQMQSIIDNIKESFCFLSMGVLTDSNDRKNIKSTIKIFQETFSGTKHDVALVLKINGPRYNTENYYEMKNQIIDINSNYKNKKSVYLLYGNFSKYDLNTLYNHKKIKTMISLTHGEGFGRPLLEASVCGLPIIASNFSGHLDFLDKEHSQLVNGSLELVDSTIPHTTPKSVWFEPNYTEVKNSLITSLENFDINKKKANNLKKINIENYSFDKMKNMYKNILSNI
jgi:glycosyltransferase involved in cell wall biosynthesis